MVHQKNNRKYSAERKVYELRRQIMRFISDNEYVDRELAEVVNLVGQDEILDMLRKKNQHLKILRLRVGEHESTTIPNFVSCKRIILNYFLCEKGDGEKILVVLDLPD